MTAALLWPRRSRCRTCRRYFGFTVIDGRYCSRECAGLPPFPQPVPFPAGEDAGSLPRECRNTGWRGAKVRWPDEDAARTTASAISVRHPMDVYQCGHCRYWHLGHGRQRAGQR